MSKFFTLLLVTIVCLGVFLTDAEARRFGGGKSFGVQRSISSQSFATPIRTAAPAAAATGNRWMGPLMGLAAGGLLAYLFMGHGMAAGVMSWLLLAAGLLLLWSLVKKFFIHRTAASSANFTGYQQRQGQQNHLSLSAGTVSDSAAPQPTYPAGFDANDFIRNAKVQFLRLQAAYDSANLQDLREFTAPDVFAELQMQIAERDGRPNITEVPHLDAKIVDLVEQPGSLLVSVLFSGMIRENPEEQATLFNEIWHFAKDNVVQKWLVTGIQQA